MDRSTTSTEPPPSGTPEPHERPGLRSLRDIDVRVFSSASDAPRARRPTDVVLVALALLTIGGMALVAPGPGALDTASQRLVQALPGLFGWFWETAYDVLFMWAVVLIAIPIAARKRTRMLVGELLAVAITFIVGSAVAGLAGVSGSESVRAIASSDPPARYPAMRVAIAAAVVVAASPHVSRPLRRIGRIVLILGAGASVAVGVALPSGVVAGFAVGIGVAALVHLLLGSPGGRLSLDQARLALADLGVAAVDLRYAPLSPSGVAIILGRADDGRSIRVKIYGRDAWDGQLITSVWSSVWNRGETPRVGGRLEQVEHEAFVTLLAERSGIAVQPVVTAGLAEGRDAIVVIDTGDARPLSALDATDVDDATLARIWNLDAALFHARIAPASSTPTRSSSARTARPPSAIGRRHGVCDHHRAAGRPRAAARRDRAHGRDGARGPRRAYRARERRDRRGPAVPAAGGVQFADQARALGRRLEARRPPHLRRRDRRRRGPEAGAAPARDARLDRDGRRDRPGRVGCDLGGRERRHRQPDPGVQGGRPRVARRCDHRGAP